MFKTYEPVNTNHKVFTTNGGVGKGTIDFNKVILKDVLYVPDLKANLLSLTQVVIDTAWRFILDSESCFLCIKATGKKISSVRRIGGLLLDGLEEDAWQPTVHRANKVSSSSIGDSATPHFIFSKPHTPQCSRDLILKA